MGIKNLIKKAGAKAANTINKLSVLSPDQIEEVERKQEEYLSEIPDPNDPAVTELTARLLAMGGVEIFDAYLPQIQQLYIPVRHDVEYDNKEVSIPHNIRCFNITKWVTDKEENSLDKLVNIYQVLSNENCNIALIFHRMHAGTDVYLAVLNADNADNNVEVDSYKNRLAEAIKGNCPGSEIKECNVANGLPCFDDNKNYSVATASNIPTEKSEKFVSQTIEKLLDGIVPQKKSEEYTLVLLATPVLDVEERKFHLTDLYTALSPYSSWTTHFDYNENNAIGSSATFGVNAGVSAGVQNGVNNTISNTQGEAKTEGETTTDSEAHTDSTSEGESETKNESSTINGGINLFLNAGASKTKGTALTKSTTKTISDTITHSLSKMSSKTLSSAKTVANGISKATNFGANFGANFARSSNITTTIGKGEGITQSFTDYNIKHALELLEGQMKRYEKSTALGMWDFAAYVLSEDINVANNVAHTYIALTQGEESYLSHAAINLWRGDRGKESEDAREIYRYLRELRHPMFGLRPDVIEEAPNFLVYPATVNATTVLSGKELAYSLNFPKKSIAGLPVLECAEFGRNIITYDGKDIKDKTINIGRIYHMHHEEPVDVNLSLNSLASHTFITGSTGAGKSNTIYTMLDEAEHEGVKYMVIEPAKGEYKNVFGMNEDVFVYGTNPSVSPLLRIDPFSFPDDIHVLEHIDRLVEIFNVCWPMYAAMPAVLKDAIEKSYEDCGWDLKESSNSYDRYFYPSFADVARNIKTIIDTSEYDTENKGAYKGSLLTRLKSLTNGINGMIFTSDEIPQNELFDENVIADLSRVGSSETKSLIMGMLVLKLQEYRLSSGIEMNSELRHITVLEEAHNILKKTSTEQVTESANLLGKSVEMISNAIAEMRTYGEGFIIADQAPGLVDMSAIRNTNTKIIMRLPDEGDRELVGLAASLNEAQISELSKLPCGVAAVYQNEWIQPVLCKVKKYESNKEIYSYSPSTTALSDVSNEDRVRIAEILSNGTAISQETLNDQVKPLLGKLHLDASTQVSAIRMMLDPSDEPRMTKLAPVFNALFPEITEAAKKSYNESNDPEEWTESVEKAIESMNIQGLNESVVRDIIQCSMTYYLLNVVGKIDELQRWSERGGF